MLVKFAIKTAIAGAFLGALSGDAFSFAHQAYPALGLIMTMQSSLGGTVKKIWGGVVGSPLGEIIGT